MGQAVEEEIVYEPGNHIVVCHLEDMVDDGMHVLVQRAVREARDNQAVALIFEVDTFGGRVDSAVDIANTIGTADIPTIAYVIGKGAISAGALISIACDDITMRSGTSIGAATPVIMTNEGMQPTDEKSVSFLRSTFRGLAQKNGHNVALAEAMVDADIELRLYRNEDGELEIRTSGTMGERARRALRDQEDEDRLVERVVEALDERFPVPDEVKEAARDLATERKGEGTSPTIAEPDADIPADGLVILPSGKLLTLASYEALEYGLIAVESPTLQEVKSFYGYGDIEQVNRIEPTWAEDLFRFLTSPIISSLLLLLGMGGLYLEVRTPGFGLPGLLGMLCLALFFGPRMVLGLTGWIDILLLLIGIGLLLTEIFVLPGFGIAGVAGLVCLALGFYLGITRVPIPQYEWDFVRLEEAGFIFVVSFGLFLVLTLLSWRFLPASPLGRRMVLATDLSIETGYTVQTEEDERLAIGLTGVATTTLRPAGRGRFNNKNISVVSYGQYIDAGTPIRIVEVEGNRHVVAPVRTPDENAS